MTKTDFLIRCPQAVLRHYYNNTVFHGCVDRCIAEGLDFEQTLLRSVDALASAHKECFAELVKHYGERVTI